MKFILGPFIDYLNNNIENISLSDTYHVNNPKFLYHLTSGININSIRQNGLCVDYSIQHTYSKCIYLCDSIDNALKCAEQCGITEDYYVIEIPFINLDVGNMRPDDYKMINMIYSEYDKFSLLIDMNKEDIYDNANDIYNALTYNHSLYICEQMLYVTNISPFLFSNVYNVMDLVTMKK